MRTLTFSLFPLRFVFLARDPIFFPEGKSGNILRGAFGEIFRQIGSRSTYARIFEPRSEGEGPSGLADSPRPFVFRAMHLDGKRITPGEQFHFDLNLFITEDPPLQEIIDTFGQLATRVSVRAAGRAELAEYPNPASVHPMLIDLQPVPERVSQIRVRYLTPTELKTEEGLADRPEFPILFSRARDRIATLRALYGAGPLAI